MTRLCDEPYAPGDIGAYGQGLRSGRIRARDATRAYLARIDMLNQSLRAYEYVAWDAAMEAAAEVDRLLGKGIDLGPLMGVPVAVKDVLQVAGMPTRVGSDVDVADLVGEQGGFVDRLRRAGCIVLGKTHTVEFAVGSTGLNLRRGTPRNPCDPEAFRLPAGSSSGSAVAVAAGLCGLAVGTDTGGSVRGPAAFCGVFGLKFSQDSASRDGMFPMSDTFDSVGLMATGASGVATAWTALTGQAVPRIPVARLRLGRPRQGFFDGLAPEVARCTDAALAALACAGARVVEVDVPEFAEIDELYMTIARAELFASLGAARFDEIRDRLNPDVADRIEDGRHVSAERYLRSIRRCRELRRSAARRFDGLDAWVAPVKQHLPPALPGLPLSLDEERELARLCMGPTRPANVLGLCACSLPIHQVGAPLPVGMQLLHPGAGEARLLAIALACEDVLGRPETPDMTAYARPTAVFQ